MYEADGAVGHSILKYMTSINQVVPHWIGPSRLIALAALLLWCAALFSPIAFVSADGIVKPDSLLRGYGWQVAFWGWIGPVGLAPGWYANILFAISLVRCFRGQLPGRWRALIGLAIAATALAPLRYWSYKGEQWYYLQGPALWLWLGALAILWLPVILKRDWSRDRHR